MKTLDPTDILPRVDHLIYGTPDLETTTEDLEQRFGVRASAGGQHLGEGTRNALYSLGPGTYLEILAPDPDQPSLERPRWLGIDELTEARLVTWVAKARNLDQVVANAANSDVSLGTVLAGSRTQPDGSTVSWRVTDPHVVIADGIVPFLIDWGETAHPSRQVAQGLTLTGVRAEHPDWQSTRHTLRALNLDLVVTKGPRPELVATIETPHGVVELR